MSRAAVLYKSKMTGQHVDRAGDSTKKDVTYFSKGGIAINPAHKGQFTAKATRAGAGVQAYASRVLSAPKGKYSGINEEAGELRQASEQVEALNEARIIQRRDLDTLLVLRDQSRRPKHERRGSEDQPSAGVEHRGTALQRSGADGISAHRG